MNPKVRHLKDWTLMYMFDVMYKPGIKNRGPDTTSRFPGTRGMNVDKSDKMDDMYSYLAVRQWLTSRFKTVD